MVMTELVVRAQSARAVPLIRIALWKSPDAEHKSKVIYSLVYFVVPTVSYIG
jgi:Na+/melibiose symporter-like transporter